MHCRVRRVHKLSWDEAVRNLLCQFVGPGNGTFHSLGSIGKNKLCAVCFQNVSTLNTHGLWHGEDDSVSLSCCDRCQTDSGISRSWLNDYGTFLQDSLLLCILDHSLGNSVLNASCRVKVFQLHKNSSFQSKLLLNISNLYKWGVSDQSKCSLIVCHIHSFPGACGRFTFIRGDVAVWRPACYVCICPQ